VYRRYHHSLTALSKGTAPAYEVFAGAALADGVAVTGPVHDEVRHIPEIS
jgi:hypothetical protein